MDLSKKVHRGTPIDSGEVLTKPSHTILSCGSNDNQLQYGVMLEAKTLNEHGKANSCQPPFFWKNGSPGIGVPIPLVEQCFSCPAGHVQLW
ncbi:hypothetical protein [Candidatus Pelagisphaera phototrophica]|uniref:hypothetical protein n=1 Tax=Candidatus Pelagisphaera phototrophica TaxID=2684113 RepID=UPI001A034C1F|nr:hypothetical protein [Candidatus Pelagisphaera phototrophica]QXD31457.1 hypothetical protein GA004_14160 [Candidatus Pelagisphaera phototrophica]